MTYYWPGEMKAKVAAFLKEGKTARQIGDALGFSRNSIIGVVRRNHELAAIGFASRPGGKPPPPQNERQAYDRAYMRAYKAKKKGIVIPFPAGHRPRLPQQKSRPALRIVSNNEPLMIQDWLERNGGPRRFEPNATSDQLAIQIWLRERGIYINGYQAKWTISTSKGRPKGVKWAQIMEMVDKIRAEEGLEPFGQRDFCKRA